MNKARLSANIMNESVKSFSEKETKNSEAMEKMYNILQSLQDASSKAGRKAWTTEELEKTSVKELLFQLATNNIRFIYVPENHRPALINPPKPMEPFVIESDD